MTEQRKTTLDGLRDIRVHQYEDGYRFSVDALLLYSFVKMEYAREIADLGAGSGIIGLLLARAYPEAHVRLFELQDSLYRLLRKNIALNGLQDRVEPLHADIRKIRGLCEPTVCDLVVSNPPYRRPGSGRLSVGDERAIARHEVAVSIRDIADSASFLLKGKGRCCLIYHPGRLLEMLDALRAFRLEPKRVRFVHNDMRSESKIVLVEAVRDGRAGLKIEKPLYIYRSQGQYTDEVAKMYTDGLVDLKQKITGHL